MSQSRQRWCLELVEGTAFRFINPQGYLISYTAYVDELQTEVIAETNRKRRENVGHSKDSFPQRRHRIRYL